MAAFLGSPAQFLDNLAGFNNRVSDGPCRSDPGRVRSDLVERVQGSRECLDLPVYCLHLGDASQCLRPACTRYDSFQVLYSWRGDRGAFKSAGYCDAVGASFQRANHTESRDGGLGVRPSTWNCDSGSSIFRCWIAVVNGYGSSLASLSELGSKTLSNQQGDNRLSGNLNTYGEQNGKESSGEHR